MSDDLEGFPCPLFLRPSRQCRIAAPILLYRVPTVLAPGGRRWLMLVGRHHLLGGGPHPLCLVVADCIDLVRHSSLWRYRLLWVLARDGGLSERKS
jgi:hypothetical protein